MSSKDRTDKHFKPSASNLLKEKEDGWIIENPWWHIWRRRRKKQLPVSWGWSHTGTPQSSCFNPAINKKMAGWFRHEFMARYCVWQVLMGLGDTHYRGVAPNRILMAFCIPSIGQIFFCNSSFNNHRCHSDLPLYVLK